MEIRSIKNARMFIAALETKHVANKEWMDKVWNSHTMGDASSHLKKCLLILFECISQVSWWVKIYSHNLMHTMQLYL